MRVKIGIILLLSMALIGCSVNDNRVDSSDDYQNTSSTLNENTSSSEAEEIDMELPALYYDVFVTYGEKINDSSYSFDRVLGDLQNTNYEINYTNPTSEALGLIEVRDGSKLYVYIDFYPNNVGIETIMDINYGATGVGEVSVSDTAHVTNVEYSYLIGSRSNVSNLSELEKYAKQLCVE